MLYCTCSKPLLPHKPKEDAAVGVAVSSANAHSAGSWLLHQFVYLMGSEAVRSRKGTG